MPPVVDRVRRYRASRHRGCNHRSARFDGSAAQLHSRAIPINGQHFANRKDPCGRTQAKSASYVLDMIKQVKFVSVPVADQDRALDFYTEKLGFTIITDQPFDEKQRWIELRVPKAETRVVLFTTDEDKNRVGTFMNMSYTCDDLQKTYEELKKSAAEFAKQQKNKKGGAWNLKTRRRRSTGAITRSLRTAKETVLCSAINPGAGL